MGKKIDLTIKENIATIKFSDPENLNPLNKESVKELLEVLESLREKNDVRV